MKHQSKRVARGGLLALALATACVLPAQASSHREAPTIAGMPQVDGTDFYLFNSYDPNRNTASDGTPFVTMVANYHPLQDSYGGPNYFAMDPKALYEIHVNNDGTGVENLTFQFRFNNVNRDVKLPVSIPLTAAGQFCGGNTCPAGPNYEADPAQNVYENYSVVLVEGDARNGKKTILTSGGHNTLIKPADYIGSKTIPNYPSYAAQHVYPIDDFTLASGKVCHGGQVFVGQRLDPFFVNLGQVFDLINIQSTAGSPSAPNNGSNGTVQPYYGTAPGSDNATNYAYDSLATKAVTAIVLELPAGCLVNKSGSDPVIGAWTTASIRQSRIVNPKPGNGAGPETADSTREGGAWTQVSRLGMPLVNEVVIGLKDKDLFNHSHPVNDVSNFAPYVLTPSLPQLIQLLYPSAVAPTGTVVAGLGSAPVRDDLIAAFLSGLTFTVPANAGLQVGANSNVSSAVTFSNVPVTTASKTTLAEMTRLNTAIPFTPLAQQRRLGLIGLDAAGFPNGRRIIDDVVDIELRVAEGRLCSLNGTLTGTNWACTPATAPAGLIDFADGVAFKHVPGNNSAAVALPTSFPYLNAPFAGSPNQFGY